MRKIKVNRFGAIPIGVKLCVAGLIFLGSVIFAWTTYNRYTKGLPPERREVNLRDLSAPPPPQEFRQFRERMIKELELTDEQRKKIQELMAQGRPASPEQAFERMREMREILTPEQQEKMMRTMRERISSRLNRQLERARRVLPPDQFEIYKKRLEERRNRFRPPFDRTRR